MEINTSTWMMIFFVLLLVVSIYKIYAFLPNKPLVDDDTTKESQEELLKIILKVIKESNGELSHSELFMKVQDDDTFNKKRFWRFNQNRLNQLLNYYHLQNIQTNSIKDIYHDLKA
ncbi:hypothetical protein [Sulfurimonas sp. CS5]|uniref:hypothetical protein n=1 Tax=Sulfurimonas sp. CS5 TaxID=3391145 RepID=UPI0039E80C75